MSKRRRTSSITSKSQEDDSLDSLEASTSSGPTMRKRKRHQDPVELIQQLYDMVRNHKKKDGSLLCDTFIRIPKRRQEPGYYDVVSNPIDLLKVQQKLRTDEYENVDELQSDIELLVNNTKSFYKRTSQEHKDASELWELFISTKNKLLNGEEDNHKKGPNNKQAQPQQQSKISRRSMTTRTDHRNNQNHDTHEDEDDEDDVEEVKPVENKKDSTSAAKPKSGKKRNSFEELYAAVMTAKDEHHKPLHHPFKLLPSKKEYPEYYEVVEQPIDLKMILAKVHGNKYNHLVEMERDLLLMCKNTCLFNEPGSNIYKQAKALRKFVQIKRLEIDPTGPIIGQPLTPQQQKALGLPHTSTAGNKSSPLTGGNRSGRIRPSLGGSHATHGRRTPTSPASRASPAGRTSLPRGGVPVTAEDTPSTPVNSTSNRRSGTTASATPLATPHTPTTTAASFSTPSPATPSSGTGRSPQLHQIGEGVFAPSPQNADDPQWRLFDTVQTVTGSNGVPLSVPFWKLPSRKMYPDYYKEIKNPMSLGQIKRKLMNKGYGNLSEVAGDLTIMFENAKKYNIPSSKLYKDAVKLQKLMQMKVQELLDIDQELVSGATVEVVRRKPGPKPKSSNISPEHRAPRGRPPKLPLKQRLTILAKYMLDYTCEDGRKPMLAFMEKPSKKLYPEYYEVIAEPIDFLEIEAKIKAEQYSCEADLVKDFRLMFSNCRQFNEENSPIFDDANRLEKYLDAKVIKPVKPRIGPGPGRPPGSFNRSPDGTFRRAKDSPRVYKPRKLVSHHERSLKTLYETIRDYREPKDNRQLSLIFMKLPSKIDYPDYYEVIKEPIDMEKISQKLKANQYETLEDMVADFHLMFDNACKFNEPDSQIYKDALILQSVCLQTKVQIKSRDDDVAPDVQAAVQDILLNLFTTVYNHQDDDGRCYSDSMAELPEHEEIDGRKVRALSLDLIKRRLHKGVYKRLDVFQEDFFLCMDRARELSRTDSQLFEDATEMQLCFINQRDSICRNGELLSSTALAYTAEEVKNKVEQLRQSKHLKESLEEDASETRSSDDSAVVMGLSLPKSEPVEGAEGGPPPAEGGEEDKPPDGAESTAPEGAEGTTPEGAEGKPEAIKTDTTNSETSSQPDQMTTSKEDGGRTFKVGEFVYLEAKEKGCEPHIVCIERLFENAGKQMLYGNFYLRPAETFHLTTRKFLEREVFKCEKHITVPLENVKEKCCVVNVKQYYHMKPEGFDDKDVYVCESRYSVRNRNFKKIKIYPDNPAIKLVPREVPLEPKRVMSVFRERVEKHKDELAELEEQEQLIQKEKPNIPVPPGMSIDDGNTYYQQFNTICSGVVKTGDFVYVVAEGGKQIIAQIDHIWETKDGKCYFRGPWFITPADIPPTPGKLFYRQEVFLSTLEDVNPIVSIIGRCHVMEYNDYIMYVYICTSMYDEINRQIRRLPQEGLRKYQHDPEVTEDELYFFPRILNPPKDMQQQQHHQPIQIQMSLSQMTKMTDMELMMDDSLDGGGCVSVSGSSAASLESQLPAGTVLMATHCPTVITSMAQQVHQHQQQQQQSQHQMQPIQVTVQVAAPPTTVVSSSSSVAVAPQPQPQPHPVPSSSSAPPPPVPHTPTPSSSKKKSNKNKVVTGYILYSREVRKQVVQNNPESTFGDISRIVGSEWKSLPQSEKQLWEERASRLNEETKATMMNVAAAAAAAAGEDPCGSPQPQMPPQDQVYECLWDTCDYQFEDTIDLIEHCIKDRDQPSHVTAFFQENPGLEFHCHWRNCARNRKNPQPFPNATRLIRHIRDMHINKGNGRSVPPDKRSHS
ncbi:unnamed protein product [Callosobruchus maculatus]|uniref:Protein polybromo-1 n=1 Tax=Callosobruchus maculatus TaxID=64391 RepID=A0A653D9P7_CALMS|nr:unnamed protein product [Callosobruchus maculatus]